MKQKIVAIGGGDFRKYQTFAIDKEIVKLSGKKQPKMLFIPTASSDSVAYADAITQHFADLGCIVDTLYLIKDKIGAQEAQVKIVSADIIYVGGGNTLKMMILWRRLGIDRLLAQARDRGIVLCGVSAGSICWFAQGNSDSRKFKNPEADYIKVNGLGFIAALNCPHYDAEADRKASLKTMMKKKAGVAIALQDCSALQVVGDSYRILRSNDIAQGYKIYWKNGTFYEESLVATDEYKPLIDLLAK